MTRFGWAILLTLLPTVAWSQAPAPIVTEPLLPPTRLYPRAMPQPGAAAQPPQPAVPTQPLPQVVQPSLPAPAGPQVVQPAQPVPAMQQPSAATQPAQPGLPPQPVAQPGLPPQPVAQPGMSTQPAAQPSLSTQPAQSGASAQPAAPAGPSGITAEPLSPPPGMAGQPGAPPSNGTPNAEAAPPAPNPWLPQGAAVLQVLDKPNAQSGRMTVKVGQSATYGSLTIKVQACLIRPPDMPQDATAYLVITDSHADQPGFNGWMLHSNPSIAMLQNPIYDVRVMGCAP